MKEGLTACMNCGICTGVCPAAEFYDYDPRQIVNMVQTKDDDAIEQAAQKRYDLVLRGVHVVPPALPARPIRPDISSSRCAGCRKNWDSSPSRRKDASNWPSNAPSGRISSTSGYCVKPNFVDPDLHPEQGPVWRWIHEQRQRRLRTFRRQLLQGGRRSRDARSTTRSMEEIRSDFRQRPGVCDFFENIETCSDKKAKEMGYEKAGDERYFHDVFTD